MPDFLALFLSVFCGYAAYTLVDAKERFPRFLGYANAFASGLNGALFAISVIQVMS